MSDDIRKQLFGASSYITPGYKAWQEGRNKAASEMLAKMAFATPIAERHRVELGRHMRIFEKIVTAHSMTVKRSTCEVCTRRARRLKKAGWLVIKWHRTSTGKQRWLWSRVQAFNITKAIP